MVIINTKNKPQFFKKELRFLFFCVKINMRLIFIDMFSIQLLSATDSRGRLSLQNRCSANISRSN